MIGNAVAGLYGVGVAPSTTAYESIATATGTGSSGAITFSSIPSTFKHLQVRILARNTAAGTNAATSAYYVNGDTTVTNYAFHQLDGDGAAASSTGSAGSNLPYWGQTPRNGTTAGLMGVGIIDFIDYASTTKNKTFRVLAGQDRNGAGNIKLSSGLWLNTAAITSITIWGSGDGTESFATSTVIALYGIKG
jgi:hypothetical protein